MYYFSCFITDVPVIYKCSQRKYKIHFWLRLCSNNKSQLSIVQLSVYVALYVEFVNTIDIAFRFNRSKAKKHNKISGTTRIMQVDHLHTWHETTKQTPKWTQRALSGGRQIQSQIGKDNDTVLAE